MIDENYESLIRSGTPIDRVVEMRDPQGADREQVFDAFRVYLELNPGIESEAAQNQVCQILPEYADDEDLREIIDQHAMLSFLAQKDGANKLFIGEPLPDGMGRFQLIERIGCGGQSEIYKAVDREYANDESVYVTVKLYKDFDGREGVRAKRVDHPNLVPFVDQGVDTYGDEPVGYVAYKYLDGVTLEQWVREHNPDRKTTLRFMIKLADAVVAMHGVGIFHRDIKPANIIVVDSEPVIIDYGVSVQGDECGSQAGTPATMAPEQLTHIVHSAKVDIYGLGAVAYFMLTRRYPNGQTPEEARANLHHGVEPNCSMISGPLRDVLAKCLSKHIPRRYDSASALGADLRAVLEQRPISARETGIVTDCVLFVRRHPMLVTLLGLIFLMGGWYLVDVRADRDRHEFYRRASLQAMLQSMIQIQLEHDQVDPAAYVVLGELGHGMDVDWTQLTNLMNADGELLIRDHIDSLAADPAYSRIKLHYWYVTLARVQRVVFDDPERARGSYINARNALLESLGQDDPLVLELEQEMRDNLP
jgi:hypothetical protein